MAALNSKYVLERRLGNGGMAEVYLGRMVGAEGFSRPVAIKRVLEGLSRDALFAEHFVTEAKISARLQHPNIVSVVDFDRDAEGRLFLVMELVDGVDLAALLGTGLLPFSVVIHLAIEILRGLDYAHALPMTADGVRGLVHRDMSPHNVLLSWEGAVKVSDFGIAKVREATAASASMIIKGKPAYMSPEQINGRPLDGRSDLFAVGAMLYEMLCGDVLFAGTPEEAYGQVLHKPISPAHEKRRDVPEDLSTVVTSLLTRELGQRMPSAEAAIAALVTCEHCPKAGREELIEVLSQRFTGRAPLRARGLSHTVHVSLAAAAQRTVTVHPAANAASADRLATSAQNRRWVWAVLAAFLIVGGVLVAFVAADSGSPATMAKPLQPEPTTPPAAGSALIDGEPATTAAPRDGRPSASHEEPVPPAQPRSAPEGTSPSTEPARRVPRHPEHRKPKPDGIQGIKL